MTSKIKSIDDFDVERMYYEEGMSQQEIADYYGVTNKTIYWRLHPEKQKENNREWQQSKKGKDWQKVFNKEYYHTGYYQTGVQGEKVKIRQCDWRNPQYQWLKRNLGDVHIHHEWVPGNAEYVFSALVDASEHMHDIINPIIFLEDNRIKLLQDSL